MDTSTTRIRSLCLAFPLLLLGSAACAQASDWRPDRVVLQAGVAHSQDVRTVSLGLGWEGAWKREWGPFGVSGQAQLLWNQWRARDFGGGTQHFHQLVALPLLRLGFDRGRSPFYLEAGIGLSVMDRLYVGPDKQMSTRFNFYDMLGAGYRFGGPEGTHELGLRYVHLSNAGLKKPNPGEDFVLVVYSAKF